MDTTFYNCTSTRKLLQTVKFAHMNGHWKDYDLQSDLVSLELKALGVPDCTRCIRINTRSFTRSTSKLTLVYLSLSPDRCIFG